MLFQLLLCGCALHTDKTARWTGTLEPIWWGRAPLYGESPDDPWGSALALRLDTPIDGVTWAVYSGGDDLEWINPDVSGAACIGGRATVEGTYVRVEHEHIPAVITGARVVTCDLKVPEPPAPLGSDVTLTGVLKRSWWYGSPGFGADPWNDKINTGAVLVVDGVVTPMNLRRDTAVLLERTRRMAFACDGQTMTVTGHLRLPKDPKNTKTPFVVDNAVFAGPCPSPQIDRGLLLPPKPMPVSWLEEGSAPSPSDP